MQQYAEQAVQERMKKLQKPCHHWSGRNPWTDETEDSRFHRLGCPAHRTVQGFGEALPDLS
jgi:hypothetical protein